jgi:protein TonB
MKSSPWREENALNFRGFPLRAFGWSLLAHAVLLIALAPPTVELARVVPPAASLRGRILPVPVVESAPARREPPRAASRPVSPPRALRTEVVPAVQAFTVPPAPTFPVAPAAPAVTPPGAAGGEPVARPAEAPATSALRQESAAVAPSESGLRQYRLALASEARRYRRYPEAARRAGLAGTAEVRVTVAAGGASRQAELNRSSGHEALDAAALEMLRQAARQATLPDSLRGQNFSVLLPVVFEVEE